VRGIGNTSLPGRCFSGRVGEIVVHFISGLLSAITALAGITAAVYWFRAAAVVGPKVIHIMGGYGGPGRIDLEPLNDFIRTSGRFNKVAATWSCLAAFAGGITAAASALGF
jgi:hypothetical protein